MEQLLKILNPMSSTIFWSIVVFAILVLVVWKFVLKPVNRTMEARRKDIEEEISDAEEQKQQAQKILEEQKQKLEEARKQARQILDSTEKEAQQLKQQIQEEAQKRLKPCWRMPARR
ncbi:MAG: F0F1 ATP synthase subunit B [Actinomycetota bacterium]|nr:F0F1 ATP synthase subunit B [Actinomycetota bacterium]